MEDFFNTLPDDPEAAFVAIVERLDAELDDKLNAAQNSSATRIHLLHHMSEVIGAAEALAIEDIAGWRIPSSDEGDNIFDAHQDFAIALKRVIMNVRIRHAKIGQHYSVELDQVAKQKIHHFGGQIRYHIERSDLDDLKKNVLLSKLNAFLAEVDRRRTRYNLFADAAVWSIGFLGKATESVRPLTELFDSITKVIAEAKSTEPPERLPAPQERKRIEAPRKAGGKHNRSSDLDDDIPF